MYIYVYMYMYVHQGRLLMMPFVYSIYTLAGNSLTYKLSLFAHLHAQKIPKHPVLRKSHVYMYVCMYLFSTELGE